MLSSRPVILTGDRTTGALHLGHYVGSLRNRVELQHTHQQYVLLADSQARTDNADDPGKVRRSVSTLPRIRLGSAIPPVSRRCLALARQRSNRRVSLRGDGD